jgi:inner membrane protein
MDNITHSLVGLMLARAGLNRGEKGGAVMVVLAANVPDIDGYSFFTNSVSYLEQHRGYMHSLAFAPLMALIPLLLVKGFTRARITAWSYFACVVAVLSHLLLDWTNVYGIRLGLPFSGRWFHLDINPLSELVMMSILVFSWGIPAMVGLIGGYQRGGEQYGKVPTAPRRAWARFALVALMVWDAGRWLSHERAIAMMEARSYRGEPAYRMSALPPQFGFSPLVWHGIVEAQDGIFDLRVDITRPLYVYSDQMIRTTDHTAREEAAKDAAGDTRAFRVFKDFDQLPYWKFTPETNATRVELLDLRFGSMEIPGFRAITVIRWPAGEAVDPRVIFGGR